MSGINLKTTNGEIVITPEDGVGTSNINLPRSGFGKLVQQVYRESIQETKTSSVSYIESDIYAHITPKYADSHIIVMATIWGSNDQANDGARYHIGVNGTVIDGWISRAESYLADQTFYHEFSAHITIRHTPNTTAETKYSVMVNCPRGASGGSSRAGVSNRYSSILLMEVRP